MNLVKVKCAFCKKDFFREKRRFNEAKKFNWKQYCSLKCLSKDRTERQLLFCENCGKKFTRTPSDFSLHNYCSQSCAAIVNNKKHPKRSPIFKICVACGQKYRKSTGNIKYCSSKCKDKETKYTPQQLIDIIKKTAAKLDRVPARREMNSVDSSCVKVFGSWNKAVKAAGFEPNRSHSQRMYKRVSSRAKDGHLCDSVSEVLIDNWFTKNNIPHEINASYPETNCKADWVIFVGKQKIFVEYFGLAQDSPRYDRAIKKKKALCRKHNLRLIEVYSQDVYPCRYIDKKLREKFKYILIDL